MQLFLFLLPSSRNIHRIQHNLPDWKRLLINSGELVIHAIYLLFSSYILQRTFSIRKYEGKLDREKGWLTFNLNEGNLKYYINVREDWFVGIFCREEYCQRVQEQWYSRPYIEIVFLSSPIFKFNDYKKKQERNIMITNLGIYNLKGTST